MNSGLKKLNQVKVFRNQPQLYIYFDLYSLRELDKILQFWNVLILNRERFSQWQLCLVNNQDERAMKQVAERYVGYPLFFDGRMNSEISSRIRNLPCCFLVTPSGRIAYCGSPLDESIVTAKL